MLRKLLTGALIAFSASALATETHGEGMARDVVGRSAYFMFQAALSTTGVSGSFNMTYLSPSTSTAGPQIRIPAVTTLSVINNYARFAGRGYIRYRTNTGEYRDIPAHIIVEVWNNGTPGSSLRDRIRVQAIAPVSTVGIAARFDGLVVQGDIIVTP